MINPMEYVESLLSLIVPALLLSGIIWGLYERRRIHRELNGARYQHKKRGMMLTEMKTCFANMLMGDGAMFVSSDEKTGSITLRWRGQGITIGDDHWMVDGMWVPFSTFLAIITQE